MGGNFETRNAFSPEFALMPWAARKVGRSVKWTANRTECFLSDYQARDLYSRSELALDAEGNFLALRGENTLNLGAYTVYFWPLRKGLSMMQGTYNIPCHSLQRARGPHKHGPDRRLPKRRPAGSDLYDRTFDRSCRRTAWLR